MTKDNEPGGPRNRATAEYYTWGGDCEGWRHLDRQELSVIEERMVPGSAEVRHMHAHARQLFYVLSGTLRIERAGDAFVLRPGDSLEIAPATAHSVRNRSDGDATFLLVSAPSTRNDRTDLP